MIKHLCTLLLFLAIVDHVAPYPIEHIVVLLEENRSFDHMLGFLKRLNPNVEGLTGKEYNLVNASDPNSLKVMVNDTSPDIAPVDPDHSVPGTTIEIFGKSEEPFPATAPMSGFVQRAWDMTNHNETQTKSVINMWAPENVPVMSSLAMEYALFDHWFASVPGPTHPNRLFAHSATSYGSTDNSVPDGGWPQEIIYDEISAHNLTWNMYYFDTPWALMLGKLRTPENLKRLKLFDEFLLDCEMGTLPNYTFLEPRYFLDVGNKAPASDQHPDHSVYAGEQLIQMIYEAIRNSPLWEKTLFIITYDEHGGFYDHFPTPQKDVPSPDGRTPKPPMPPFKFDRLGVRIPCIMVSPWIKKGTLVHAPTNGPTPSSQFELSSIPATVKKIFGLPKFLTKRDEWAGTFEFILTGDENGKVRTDCPKTLPQNKKMTSDLLDQLLKEESEMPINGLQIDYIRMISKMLGEEVNGLESMKQKEGGIYVRDATQRYINKVLGKK